MALSNWEKTKKKYQDMSEGEWKFFVEKEWRVYQKQVRHSDDDIPYWEYYLELSAQYERKVK